MSDTPVPELATEQVNNVLYPQPTGGGGTGQDAPPGSDPYTLDESLLDGFRGRFVLKEGRWITSGLSTDDTLDWDQSPVSIEGEGIWVSAVEHEDGTSPTIKLQGTEGNGGGVRNLAVYGAGDGTGTANIIETDGDTIDFIFQNIISRYGGGDAIHLKDSPGGFRMTNVWAENCTGWAINAQNAAQAKISGVHILATDGGILWKGNNSQLLNFTINTISSSNPGFDLDGNNNQISNFFISGIAGTEAFNAVDGDDNLITTGIIQDVDIHGLKVQTEITVANLFIKTWGKTNNGGIGLWQQGNRSKYSNILIDQNTGVSNATKAIRVDGSDNIFSNVRVIQSGMTLDMQSGSADNMFIGLRGIAWSDITDNGARNVVNGIMTSPPTLSLGGSNGTVSPTDNGFPHYRIKVDAGGSGSNLQGIDGIADNGRVVTVIHTGGENVVLAHDAAVTNPLINQGGADETLSTNGDQATYQYNGDSGEWMQTAAAATT